MTFFGWLLVSLTAILALTAWSHRRDTDMPNNNATVMLILIGVTIGILTIGTGNGL